MLLVVGDVPLDATFAPLVREAVAGYALALLLTHDGEGEEVAFEIGEAPAPSTHAPWPDAIEFLRWLLAQEAALTLQGGRCAWSWARVRDRGRVA